MGLKQDYCGLKMMFLRGAFSSGILMHRKTTAVSSPKNTKKENLLSGYYNLLYPTSDFMGRWHIYISIDQSTLKINYALVN